VPSEVALQNIEELIEKEAGCTEEVKYTLENVETYYEELEESEVTLNPANAILSVSDCLIICIDEYGFFNICRVLMSHFLGMDKFCFVTPVVPPWDDCVTKHVELAIEILNKKEVSI